MERIIRSHVAVWGTALVLVVGGVTGLSSVAASPAEQGEARSASKPARPAQSGELQQPRVLAGAHARTFVPRVTRRWVGSIPTGSRAAVNNAYWQSYAPGLSVPTGFTGDDEQCVAGTTADASRTATRQAINFVRSMNGLAPVAFSATLNGRSQQTALIMSANEQLSHYPTSTWECYTPSGAANAARSNLALGYPRITSSGVVGMYMHDGGASNYAVGHRRWLLNPFSTAMGSGATDIANSITVVGPSRYTRPNPAWTSWPSSGYFPSSLEPDGRWSMSAGNKRINLRYASVQVFRNGVLLRSVRKQPVRNGYAQPTLVWEMPDAVAKSGTFRVVVRGIRRAGTTKRFYRSYTVRMFSPTR